MLKISPFPYVELTISPTLNAMIKVVCYFSNVSVNVPHWQLSACSSIIRRHRDEIGGQPHHIIQIRVKYILSISNRLLLLLAAVYADESTYDLLIPEFFRVNLCRFNL